MQTKVRNILRYFPEEIEKALVLELNENYEKLEEIRIRALRPIILKYVDNNDLIQLILPIRTY